MNECTYYDYCIFELVLVQIFGPHPPRLIELETLEMRSNYFVLTRSPGDSDANKLKFKNHCFVILSRISEARPLHAGGGM